VKRTMSLIALLAAANVTYAQDINLEGIPLDGQSDLLQEASEMMELSQKANPEVKNWGLVKNGVSNMNRIIKPDGAWPLKTAGIPRPAERSYNMYVMISSSMPDSLIRSYAFDAIQTGAKLVVRGINPDETVAEAVTRWQKMALREDGAAPPFNIDPRPFTAFEVDKVPTIVLSKEPVDKLCNATKKTFSITHETAGGLGKLPYQTCEPAPDDSYYKISGNVSVPWALKAMASVDEVPELQETAKVWFNVMPNRYGTSPEEFSWSVPLSKEEYSETSNKEAVKRHLQRIQNKHPELRMYKVDGKIGLGPEIEALKDQQVD